MKNVYKTRLYRVLLNVVFGLAAALLVGFIASIWLHVLVLQVLICAAVFAFYVWTVIIGNMIVIETDGTTLTVKKGKKTTEYPLETTAIRAKTVTSSGDTECTLYLTRQGENEEIVDCELIGIGQFEQLLSDLGVGGADSVTQLTTENSNK